MVEKLNALEASALIDLKLSEGVKIIGVDGFIIEGDGYIASLDMVVDLSTPPRTVEQAAAEAKAFVDKHARQNVLFEVWTE